MTLPNPHNPAQAPAQPAAWPTCTRTQERLLQVVWRLQQLDRGWCFATQSTLARHVGISREQVNRLIRDLTEQRWLITRGQGRGRTILLRVRPPQSGACKPVTFMSHPPRATGSKNVTGGVTSMSHNINTNTPNGSIAAPPPRPTSHPTPPDPSLTAPLFHPPRVNLWALVSEQRRACPTLSIAALFEDQFRKGVIGRLKRNGRSYVISAVRTVGMTSTEMVVITCPVGNAGKVEEFRWFPEDLLKLEFYP